jgi:hypothetical protein
MTDFKTDFETVINKMKLTGRKFVVPDFEKKIQIGLKGLFPNLNDTDTNILFEFTVFIIDLISFKYHFKKEQEYYNKWTQNNYRDIKGAILLLLPFINDENNGYLLNKLTDLNQLLYAYKEQAIPSSVLDEMREEALRTHFEFGNMGISLIQNDMYRGQKDPILDLYPNDVKLIYRVMYHNFFGLLQTLEIMNGKSYVNWVNIVPLNLINYIESDIYKATKDSFGESTTLYTKIFVKNLYDYNGLWYGDIYNVFRVRYYEEAKKIKWLIFPYETNDMKLYLINCLDSMFNLTSIINNSSASYDDIDDIYKYEFENNVNKVLKNLDGGNSMFGLNTIDFEVIKYLLIYLINNNGKAESSKSKEPVITKFILKDADENESENNDDFIAEDKTKVEGITNQDIIDCFKIMKDNAIQDIWDYLRESVDMLKETAYSKFLLIRENGKYRINKNYYYQPFNDKIDIDIYKNKMNLKNIYNIAKTLSHNDNWELLERNFISLNSKSKMDFFSKLIKTDSNWLKLQGNMERQFKGRPYDYNQEIDKIRICLNGIYLIIVFEELVTMGVLNRFDLANDITDKERLPENFGPRKSMIKKKMAERFEKNKDWQDSYYYLTNDMYKNMDNITIEKENGTPDDKCKEYKYFDLISNEQEWYIFYAMDWISQISFFQHYIYHQVLYVTGATGQGKSTQVPKLLLYALKAIDYKSNGKVVCTQPRIAPTTNNATRIAEELGLPIEQPNNISNVKIKTNNSKVQYKYQKDSHLELKSNYFLRIMTDGSLLEDMKGNSTMLTKAPKVKSTDPDKFINNNIYDIIIVDEAHEHNINMDIIIALARQTCYFNNKVKLIIVSATMDEDEPIYRRYFYNNNDNLTYPIKYPINNPFTNQMFLPHAIFMDRRYHISPPGETTQYKVDEIYLDHNPIVYKSNSSGRALVDESKSALMAQELGYMKIIEICNKSSKGEILFFANGEREILAATEYLNKVLPPGNIALPYFSKLNKLYKDIIEKINIKISSIKNKRENIHTEWGPEYIEDQSVPDNIYKRSIIIATNVAEASVTINGLAYVVDNGYAKVNRYIPKLNNTILEVGKISEASRKQRKGRVGRVGDGTVYYMYKMHGRRDIKPKCKITQEDVTSNIIDLWCDKTLDDVKIDDTKNYKKLIVSSDINSTTDPNLFKFHTTELAERNYTKSSGLNEIYKSNYKIASMDVYYYSMNTVTPKQFHVFDSGQIVDNLLDKEGQFYLIHPFEDNLERNILNNIIKYDNMNSNSIPPKAHVYMLSKLLYSNMIVDSNAERFLDNRIDSLNEERIYLKSELVKPIKDLKTNMTLETTEDAITIFAARAMGCLTEVLELKLFIDLMGMTNMKELVNESINYKKFKEIYGNSNIKSDLIFIYNIIKAFKNRFSNLLVFKLADNNFVKLLSDSVADTNIDKFKQYIKMGLTTPPSNFDANLWNKLFTENKNGRLNKEKDKLFRTDQSVYDILKRDIERNESDIIKWCDTNYINSKLILKFLNKIDEYYLVNDIGKTDDNPLKFADNFKSNFMKFLTQHTIDEKIIRSFLYGRPSQFTYSFKGDKYMTFMNHEIFYVKFAEPYYINQPSETLTNLSGEMTFYLKYVESEDPNNNKNEMLNLHLLSQIDSKWLIPATPLFVNPLTSPDVFTNIVNDRPIISYNNSHGVQIFKRNIMNSWNKSFILWDTEETPILNDFYRKINNMIARYLNS